MSGAQTEKLKKETVRGKNGGARPGAGRPKGSQNRKTKERREAEQEMIQRIIANLHPVLDAQFNLAKGASYLYRIDEVGEGKNKRREHVLVTDPEEIREFLDENDGAAGTVNDSYYYITTKSPDVRAIDSLLDRVFGRAKQTTELDLPPGLPVNITVVQHEGGK